MFFVYLSWPQHSPSHLGVFYIQRRDVSALHKPKNERILYRNSAITEKTGELKLTIIPFAIVPIYHCTVAIGRDIGFSGESVRSIS